MKNNIDNLIEYLEHLKKAGSLITSFEVTFTMRGANPSDSSYTPYAHCYAHTGEFIITITGHK